jgi:hydroxypyruvate reductase
MKISPEKFATRSLLSSPWGKDICRVLAAAIHRADAGANIKNKVSLDADTLNIDKLSFDLNAYHRIFVLGVGKAAVPMAEAAREILGNRIYSGMVITKDGYTGTRSNLQQNQFELIQAGHPVPDLRNIASSSRLITLIQTLSPKDLVICLISGGGSSLLLQPSQGLLLSDIQMTTSLLLSCGASITEINTVRKHLDDFKGGGLAKLLFPCAVISLILSDVIGDSLDMVASGPTIADPTTYGDASAVLEKYQVWDSVSIPVRTHLTDGIEGLIPETIKPGDPVLDNVHNILVGNNSLVVQASVQAAKNLGFSPEIISIPLQGEASLVGQIITEHVKTRFASNANPPQPTCFVAGGETTVTVKGNGKGGRNQELALGAVKSLSTASQMVLVSLATDGGDGPTDAAGAVVTSQTYSLGQAKGLDPLDYLLRNDSYNYFDPLGDLVKIGPTLTNVNDLLFIFGS